MAPGGPTAHAGTGAHMGPGAQAEPVEHPSRTGHTPGRVEPVDPDEYDEYDDAPPPGGHPRGRQAPGEPARPAYTAGPGEYDDAAAPGRGPSRRRGNPGAYAGPGDPGGPVSPGAGPAGHAGPTRSGEYGDPADAGRAPSRTRDTPGPYAGPGGPSADRLEPADPAGHRPGAQHPAALPAAQNSPAPQLPQGTTDPAVRNAPGAPVPPAGTGAGPARPQHPTGRRRRPAAPSGTPQGGPALPPGDGPHGAPGDDRATPDPGTADPATATPAPATADGNRRRPGRPDPAAQEPDTGPYPHTPHPDPAPPQNAPHPNAPRPNAPHPGAYDDAPPPYAASDPRRSTGRPVQDPDTGPYPHDGNRGAPTGNEGNATGNTTGNATDAGKAAGDDTGEVRTVRTSQTPHPAHGTPDTQHPRRGDPTPAVPAQHDPRTQGDARAQSDPRTQGGTRAQNDPRTQGAPDNRQPGPQPHAAQAADPHATDPHASGHTPVPVDPRHELQTPARGIDPRRATPAPPTVPAQDAPPAGAPQAPRRPAADPAHAQATPAGAPGPRPAATGSATTTGGGATRFARSAATPAMPALPAQQTGPISVRTLGQGVAYVEQPSGPPSQGGQSGDGTQDGQGGPPGHGTRRGHGAQPSDDTEDDGNTEGNGNTGNGGHDPYDPYDAANDSAHDPYASAGDPAHAPTHDPYDSADEHTGGRRRRLGAGTPPDGTSPHGGDPADADTPREPGHPRRQPQPHNQPHNQSHNQPHGSHPPQAHRQPPRPGAGARRDAIGRAFAIGAPDASAAEGPEPLDGRHGVVEVAAQDPETTPLRLDDEMPPEPLDNPRRLLVWPEPDAATQQALTARNYRPVVVHSREELDAQISVSPAGLFVDPLTGPITRTALQSLRMAAVEASVPVLVTAGLGQATREAAYGADPAVLLKALAPRDSEQHPPRVLLFEENPDIADALAATLERRGMQVMHASSDEQAVDLATRFRPNLVVMDLLRIRRRRTGIVDWLNANGLLNRTPMVVYTAVDINRAELPRLRSGETVLFLAERSTSAEVQNRIVDLLAKIGTT